MTAHSSKSLAPILILALAGCFAAGPPLETTTEVFHVLPPDQALTFAVVTADDAPPSLEQRVFHRKLSDRLQTHGWQPSDQPDVRLTMTLTGGEARTVAEIINRPLDGTTGYRGAVISGTVDDGRFEGTAQLQPTIGITGHQPTIRHSNQFRSTLTVYGVDAETDEPVYQASVIAVGACGLRSAVIDEMLDALFDRFPGRSGEPRVEQTRVSADC